jgi:hypothetical protein
MNTLESGGLPKMVLRIGTDEEKIGLALQPIARNGILTMLDICVDGWGNCTNYISSASTGTDCSSSEEGSGKANKMLDKVNEAGGTGEEGCRGRRRRKWSRI